MSAVDFNSTSSAPRGLRARLEAGWAAFGRSFGAYLDRLSRYHTVERLNAMSDEELARMGISRDRIVYYVFRDKLFV